LFRIVADHRHRSKRDAEASNTDGDKEHTRQTRDETIINTIKREARKFCENGGGV
jgi:hypothetical protein